MAIIGHFSLILCLLATTNAISRCNEDKDCPENQYCYDVSHHCVNYTICSRYNRQEGKENARHPSNCGPCISGYAAEILSTGEPANVCSKTVVAQKEEEHGSNKKSIYIWLGSVVIGIAGLVIFLIAIKKLIGNFLNAQIRQDNGCRTWTNMCNFGPSAPPLETGAFIEVEESQQYSAITNNNHNYTNKNKLVSAIPFNNPDWIKSNPNYNIQQNESLDIPEQPLTPESLSPEEDTNPSSWTPEQTSGPISTRPFSQFNSEQRDNAMNAVLVQRNCPADSSNTESSDSTSENTDSQSNSNHVRGPNILINQKITMNVNVLNGDF